jgi:hypothetical protein
MPTTTNKLEASLGVIIIIIIKLVSFDPVGMAFQDVGTHARLTGLVTDPVLLLHWIWLLFLALSAHRGRLHHLALHASTLL